MQEALHQWLPRCLDSVLAQTYSKLEIIVVDDGSADNTRQVMEDYAARDGRIRPIFKENGGVTSARLAGVAAATGEWVGFADGDDAIDPDMYRHLLENAHAYGELKPANGWQIALSEPLLQALGDLLGEHAVSVGW